jgi:tubulin alpha
VNTEAITNAVFDPANQLFKCDPPTGKYMSGCLLYRGEVNLEDANAAIGQVKSMYHIQLIDWCSRGFKVGIINHPQVSFPGDPMALAKRSVTMLSNTTTTVSLFTELAHKFDLMYQKREFVDLYIDEGMDEDKFNEAREGLAALIRDYEEIAMD